jgi:AGCS family alanine or glycine:cation symporter
MLRFVISFLKMYCKQISKSEGYIMDILALFSDLSNAAWALPVLGLFFCVCVFMTLQLDFVQIRHFAEAIRLIFKPRAVSASSSSGLTPFQAFMNTLGGNIGNGSLTNVPVAIVAGGPGAIFWLLVMSTLAISLRFAEVFLSSHFAEKATPSKNGPMLYISQLPLGLLWAKVFTLFGFAFMIVGGNMIQCNAVGGALARAWNINVQTTAIVLGVLVAYIVLGGAKRIVKSLDKLVPIKVFGFLFTALIVVLYHWASIPQAFSLIYQSAFNPQAFLGGTLGFAWQQMIQYGFMAGTNTGESGLGTAAIAFGLSKGQNPVKNGIMSMLAVYINTHIICLLIALCVLGSGVANNGETSIMLLVSAYETVFGPVGGWIVSGLSVLFATSAVVAFAYIARECWESLFKGHLSFGFPIFYVICAVFGTLLNIKNLIGLCSLAAAGMFWINVAALLWFSKTIRSNLLAYEK